jgi:predicted RNA polymerase sigma factor
MTTARRRILDSHRHDDVRAAFVESEILENAAGIAARIDARHGSHDSSIDAMADPRLRLLFVCTHPALDRSIRTPLMLQSVLGFDAQRIASAYLVSPASMSQRLVRAKRKIRDAKIPFDVPPHESLPERIGEVLQAVYAAYAEGWMDPLGQDAERRDFAEEAIWLGRMLVELCPHDAEVRGLLALMLYLESRRHARHTAAGEFVPLSVQSPEQWDQTLIDEAESLLTSARLRGPIGRFQLEAAVQSVHAARIRTGVTDYGAIVALYDALYTLVPTAVVAINRAVAIAEASGPDAGLHALNAVVNDPSVQTYQPFWAARAELLARAGDRTGAIAAYDRAIGLATDPALRDFLSRRRATCEHDVPEGR